MKRILKITALALVIALGSSLTNTASAQYDEGYNDGYSDYNDGYGDRDVSYQTFYDELSPHGRWVDYPGHGYVWVPDAGPDFRPYSSNGHWVYSEDYEWIWVSDYDWGWAPFHYGRWDHDPYYGWYWVPGYEWSPAWVAWRDGGDYYGWAPIRPGINISINFNIGGYAPPIDFWCFAPRRYITYPRIYDYCVPYRQNTTIINHTTIIVNNFRYGGSYGFRSGPRRYDAERYAGRINPVRLRQSGNPGRTTFRNNEVSVYRPNVRRESNRTFAPRSFERYDRNNANSNSGFRRNNTGNNEVVRRNDNTQGGNNRFERRDNTPGNDRVERRNTNTPGSNTDRRFERRDDVRQPQTNPGNPNGQTRRIERNSTNNPNRDPRVRSNEDPRRQQMERRVEPRQQQPQQQPRQFERRQEPRQQPQQQPRQIERRQEPRPQPQQQQQGRQFERRQEPRPQPQQVERRQESRPQPQQQQQQQTRPFERKENGNSNSGNGNGRGRSRN
jgi:hypothetical protein